MKAIVVVGAMALALVASSALAQKVVREYRIGMQLDVDAHGQVAHVGAPDGLPPVLVDAVRQTASHWRFKPIQVGGHPVSASTWVNATVQLVKRADGRYGVQVVYDRNGPKLPVKHIMLLVGSVAPVYEREVSLQVAFEVEPDGSMHVLRLLKHDGHEYRMLYKATRKAIESSRAVPMRVAGKPVASIGHIGFGWCVGRGCESADSGGGHAAPASSPMPSGHMYAVDNALQFVPTKTHATVAAQKSTSG